MRLLCLLVWKNWRSSPLRVVITWLGVALGVTIVSSIHVLDHNTILSQLERKRWDYGRVDFELRPLDPRASLQSQREELERREDVDRVGLFAGTPVETETSTGDVRLISMFGLAPVGGDRFGHYRVAEGRDLGELDPDSDVLIAPGLAAELGLSVDDEVAVRAIPAAQSFRCQGGQRVPGAPAEAREVRPVRLRVRGILEPVRLARRDGGRVIVGRFSLVAGLARAFAPLLQVKRAAGADPDELERDLRARFAMESERSALIGEDADERAFRNGVRVLGCLALVLGMFVIFHTLSHALAEKIRRVGVLRALGATSAQVSAVFLVDALVLSLVGTASGILGGIGLARWLAAAQITTLGLGKAVTTFEMPWSPLLAVAGLGILVTMLGAAFPLLKVAGLSPQRILHARDLAPPADLMRGANLFLFVLLVGALPLGYLAMSPLLSGEGRGAALVLGQAIGIVALFFAVLLLSPRVVRGLGALPLRLVRSRLAAFLVRKNLLRSPGRLATSVCGLTLVALAMLGMRALTSSLKGEIRRFGSIALDHRLFVQTRLAVPEVTWRRLQSIPGVATALPLSALAALPFRCVGTDAAQLARPGGPLADRPQALDAMRERRGIVVSSRLARLRGLAVGLEVPVSTDAGTVRYEVLAVSDREGFFPDERAWGLADRAWLKQDFCIDADLSACFSLRLRPDADPGAVVAAAAELLGPLSWSRTGEEVMHTHLVDVDRDFRYFDILLYLLLVLAGLGQVNLITLTTIARSREIGVLRALGMTRGAFLGVLLAEATVVGFLTGLMAVVAGLPLSWVLVRGLQLVSGLDVPFVLPWLPALAIAGLAFAVSLLAALVPALRATAALPAVAVRSTE